MFHRVLAGLTVLALPAPAYATTDYSGIIPTACPRCGGELSDEKEVERPVRVGDDIAIVNVRAFKCTRCGELLMSGPMVERVERARKMLEQHAPEDRVIGQVYDLRSIDAA